MPGNLDGLKDDSGLHFDDNCSCLRSLLLILLPPHILVGLYGSRAESEVGNFGENNIFKTRALPLRLPNDLKFPLKSNNNL